jgi:hypothetical protein
MPSYSASKNGQLEEAWTCLLLRRIAPRIIQLHSIGKTGWLIEP